jgi:hypothetical protein
MKTELLVLGSLAMLGGTLQSFRQLKPLTHICASDHSNFFLTFVERIASISHEYVFMPRTLEELEPIMQRYEEEGLPGVAGSVDVVHVKRANCPAGDFNRSKGKDSYPSLAFECITDYDRRILGVFGPQFGSNNDKHIVKINDNIRLLNEDWLSQVEWKYYAQDGSVSSSTGVYVSTQTRNLPLLEMGRPFPVMVPLPEVRNPISGTAFTIRFFRFLARAHVQSRSERDAP